MRRLVSVTLSTLVFIACSLGASAKTIRVPADQPTIQAGIDAAAKGDVVLVSPGTYKENINFNGKKITVTSVKGPGKTIIDGQRLDTVVTFRSGETRKAVLSGFTLQNGYSGNGGGVAIYGASPTIENNVIVSNSSCGSSDAIGSASASPLLRGNIIEANGPGGCGQGAILSNQDVGIEFVGNIVSGNQGNGFTFWSPGTATIQSNVFVGNLGYGIALGINEQSPVNVIQNLIIGNHSGGVYWYLPPVLVADNTIADNGAYYSQGSEILAGTLNGQLTFKNNLLVSTGNQSALSCDFYDSSNPPIFSHNDVFAENQTPYSGGCPDLTGTGSNISADPLFIALLSNNYHVQSGSPVIDAGDNSAPHLPARDFDGDARIANNTVDIGVDEYFSPTTLALSAYSLRYGPQDVGTVSPPQTVTLTNHGASKTGIHLVATGSNYSQANNCGKSLNSGASCQIKISFAPGTGGVVGGVLGIMTGATNNPLVVDLTGTASAPAVNLNPQWVDFYSVIIGTQNSLPSVLTNVGQAPLTISSIVLSGASDFSQTNDCPLAPQKLEVGASCTFTITWLPTVVGYENANITITDNASPNTQTINISGQSYSAGIATLAPDHLTFPNTLVGDTSDPQLLTLTNTGTGPLGSIDIQSQSQFPYETNCPPSLPPGSNCQISVSFVPSSPGDTYGYLYVYNDSPNTPQAQFTGTGISPVPAISSVSPSGTPVLSKETYVTITGTGFIPGSQAFIDDTLIATYCCDASTQFSFYIPESYLQTTKTWRLHVTNPAPGGGDSNAMAFTVYAPVNYGVKSTDYRYHKIAGTNLDLQYYYAAVFNSPFPIQFGGGSYTFITVGAGGTISFSGYANEYNQPIPISDATIIVAPFWSALYPWGNGNDNNVFWAVEGTAPDRKLIIEWRNVGYCCETSNTIKFQVVFFEGNSNILFNYADTIFGGDYSSNDNGATATAGVQVAPNLGTQFSYNTPSLMSKTSLLWYPDQSTAIVSSSVLDFGYHVIGTWSLPQALTLTNGGLVPLNINGISIDNPDYAQTNDCGTNLPPHKSCTIHVKFKPSQASGESGTLTIDDDAIGGPQHVTLNGTGAIQPIVIFPLTLHFGGVQVGQKNTLPVTLANAANSDLTVEQIMASPNVYTQTNNCGTSLAPGLYCTIKVTFAPTQKGQANGKLSMGLDGKPLAVKVKMVGTGK